MKSRFYPLLGLLITLLCASCRSNAPHALRVQWPLTAEQYQKKAEQSSDLQTQSNHVAQATEQLIWQKRFAEAQTLLPYLSKHRPALSHLLRAQWALVQNRPRLARYHLRLPMVSSPETRAAWPKGWQERYFYWSICADHAIQDTEDALVQRIQWHQWLVLQGYPLDHNLNAIWESLPHALIDLAGIKKKYPDFYETLQAWVLLKQTIQSWSAAPTQWLPNLIAWREAHPHHMGNRLFDRSLSEMQDWPVSRFQRIALLLPMHGPYARVGQAIRNGFLAAYYQSQDQSSRNTLKIHLIDTATQESDKAYQAAIDWGADFVVGPLQREQVDRLASLKDLPIPVLTLNQADHPSHRAGLYHFVQQPEDEAKQLARRALRQHHRYIIAIAPDNRWGKRVIATFQQTLEQKGGHILDTLYFDRHSNGLRQQIKDRLHIQASEARFLQLQALQAPQSKEAMPMRFIARRRRDIDAILIAAPMKDQKRIIPLLRFFYVTRIPLYVMVPTGSLSTKNAPDLKGVLLSTMPWLMKTHPSSDIPFLAVRKQMRHVWGTLVPERAPFHAIGVDAFYLAWYWPRLLLLPKLQLHGATGDLTRDAFQFHRLLQDASIGDHGLIKRDTRCLSKFE